MKSFLRKIRDNNKVMTILCAISKIKNFSFKPIKNNGKQNKIQFATHTFFNKTRLVINGNQNQVITHGKTTLRNLRIHINGNNNKLILNDGVKFYEMGHILFEGSNCTIEIGEKTTVGGASIFCTEDNTKINIGKDCMFGREIRLRTGDSHSILDNDTKKRINKSEDIIIGNKVWLGYHCNIMKGSVVSDNSIVGTFTIVNKKFLEKNVALAGIPAKVVKQNIDWDRRKLPME